MNYLWQEFNIKTFPANTIVYLDGILRDDLSDNSDPNLPTHVIFVGDISGNHKLEIINSQFLTVKIKVKKTAFLDIFIKNTEKNNNISANLVCFNESSLKVGIKACNFTKNTEIFVKAKILAGSGSETDLLAAAEIAKSAPGAKSDVFLSAMCAPDIKSLRFHPAQIISSIPDSAQHSADIFAGTPQQIQYLGESGMTNAEIKAVLEESFINS
ncbi:MAG: hypothetical protein LBO08_03220 [Rickettsiales bacterium]|nr:hypothetical protein [Rickettsiales bacterium]